MGAVLRKLRCDLRSHRLQRVSIAVLVALAVSALSVSLTIQLRGGTAWEELYRDSNGAHVWVYGQEPKLNEIAVRPGVVHIRRGWERGRQGGRSVRRGWRRRHVRA